MEVTIPQSPEQVLDTYFMEHRAKLIDIAAYLDRLDRAREAGGEHSDFRDDAFQEALTILNDGQPHRAKRILHLLSDHTTAIPQSAHGMKGASGAPTSQQPEGGAE